MRLVGEAERVSSRYRLSASQTDETQQRCDIPVRKHLPGRSGANKSICAAGLEGHGSDDSRRYHIRTGGLHGSASDPSGGSALHHCPRGRSPSRNSGRVSSGQHGVAWVSASRELGATPIGESSCQIHCGGGLMPISERFAAEPTKDFFIYMLTKDIELIPAVGDLVDNAVDGARRLRGTSSMAGLHVKVVAETDRFEISDNCGGIPFKLARDYAFRFGRPDGTPQVSHAVGQFGVGMKRALFKLGSAFSISSSTTAEQWSMQINVVDWREEEDWDFPVASYSKRKRNAASAGTTIVVEPLLSGPSEDFALSRTITALSDHLRMQHNASLRQGLSIKVNGTKSSHAALRLLRSADIRPAYERLSINGSGEPVDVRVYAGIANSNPIEAGWYVICNNRLVVRQTSHR